MIIELKYSGTNTYLIRGTNGSILFDMGWVGSFPQFCGALGGAGATVPIVDEDVRVISCGESRPLLEECGIAGEVVHTPGHGEDSISLCLDEGGVICRQPLGRAIGVRRG